MRIHRIGMMQRLLVSNGHCGEYAIHVSAAGFSPIYVAINGRRDSSDTLYKKDRFLTLLTAQAAKSSLARHHAVK